MENKTLPSTQTSCELFQAYRGKGESRLAPTWIQMRVLVISLLLLALVLSPTWLPPIGKYLVVADPLQKADAMVILAGDETERPAGGAQLFLEGYAEWMILTDIRIKDPEWQGIYLATVKPIVLDQGVPADRILILPEPVASTFEEAQRLREFTTSHGFHSLIVVTSPPHTRRARWILGEVFSGSGVSVSVRPAPNHSYNAETWWRTAKGRREAILEYIKMISHLLGIE